MSDFAASWALSRGRFVAELEGLSADQLNWRLHPDALTIGEMALHVAGVEVSFVSQLLDSPLDDGQRRLKAAATEGVVNGHPFPFDAEAITPTRVAGALAEARTMVEAIIERPSEALRAKQIVSALGPVIDGTGALARLAFHAGYHQGQVHLIRTAPGFPAS